MPLERVERAPEVGDEVRSEVAAEAVAHEDPLHGLSASSAGSVYAGTSQPRARSRSERSKRLKPRSAPSVDAPGHGGDAAVPVAVVDDVERPAAPAIACAILAAVS